MSSVLAAFPERWLPPLARALAWLERCGGTRAWRDARHDFGLAFGLPSATAAQDPLLRDARRFVWLDRLRARHGRGRWPHAARRALTGERLDAGMLLLTARFGGAATLASAAQDAGVRVWDAEAPPRRAGDAASLEWLGRRVLVDVGALRRACAQGRPVGWLLLLPDATGAPAPWHGPPCPAPPPEQVEALAQHVLDAYAALARARPDLVAWGATRWPLRAEIVCEAQPRTSRLAPWEARRLRQRRATSSSLRRASASSRTSSS